MKKRINLILLTLSLASLLLQAKDVQLKDVVLQTSTNQSLRNYIENLQRNGDHIQATGAQKTSIKKKLNLTDDQLNQLLGISIPTPPAQQPSYARTFEGNSESGAQGTGMSTSTAGTGTPTAPTYAQTPQESPSAPTAPQAPGIPEAPAMPGVSGTPFAGGDGGTFKPGKKQPEELTSEQLAALSPAIKQESDSLLIDAIKEMALVAVSPKYVKEMSAILEGVLKSAAFKPKKALKDLIAPAGALAQYLTTIKDMQASGDLHEDLDPKRQSTAARNMAALFAPVMFDQSLLSSPDVLRDFAIIVMNCAVSQRTVTNNPGEGARILSDIQAATIIGEFLESVKADAGFKKFVQDTAAAKASKDKQPIVVVLTQDYIPGFAKELERLLVHQKFLKFADDKGMLGGKKTILAPDGLLALLSATDPSIFNARRFRGAMAEQLYYDPSKLDDIVKEDGGDELKAALADHSRRLKEVKITVIQLLNKELANVKTVWDIKNKIILARSRAITTEKEQQLIAGILAALEAPKPDATLIGKNLQSLGVAFEFVSKVKKIITDEMKKLEILGKVKAILEKAASQSKPVDAFLVQELKSLLNAYQFSQLAGTFRTVNSAYSVLISLIGKAALAKIVTLNDFYNWLYEYGVLTQLFKSLPAEAKGMTAQQVLDRLVASLISMNTGEIKSNQTYYSTIKTVDNQQIITANKYKGKLTDSINAINNFDFEQLRNLVTQFVAQAHIGIETNPEFVQMMDETIQFLVKTAIDELIRQLQLLSMGEGSYQVEGLLLTGKDAGRNALAYHEWKNLFKSLEDKIRAGKAQLDIQAFKDDIALIAVKAAERLNASKEKDLKKLDADQKKAMINSLQTYLMGIATKLERLKKLSTTPSAQSNTSSFSGIPQAPLAPGEVPGAPEAPMAPEAPAAPPL